MVTRWLFVLVALIGGIGGCQAPEPSLPSPREPAPDVTESRPLKQGFTQRPSPDTPGLPPQIAPLLDEAEAAAAAARAKALGPEAFQAAQRELDVLVKAFEERSVPHGAARIRERATVLARDGELPYRDVEVLYAEYLFPNVTALVDAKYKGKLVLLEGTVAPANMRDFADGFKLIDQDPYVHDPLLLAIDYELSFVECSLVLPSEQPLRDWQPVHLIVEVVGKRYNDLMLRRCVVL